MWGVKKMDKWISGNDDASWDGVTRATGPHMSWMWRLSAIHRRKDMS
jgi:hypothetical protein